MRIVSTAFKGLNVCFVGECGRHTRKAAQTLARAAGATVHAKVQVDTHVVFNGHFHRMDESFQNLQVVDELKQMGVHVPVVAAKLFEPLVTGELAIGDVLINPMLPKPAAAGPYVSAL